MQSNLIMVFQIQKELDLINYPDSHRVSREIVDFLSENPEESLKDVLNRLKKDEPWEYIQGYTEFCNNRLTVNSSTLIPRIETEQLVTDSFEYIQKNSIKNIVDVGTGSGCIAISLSKMIKEEIPYSNISIYATDISEEALDIAKINEKEILKNSSINWIHTDLIKDLPTLKENSIVLANLPYIPTKQYLELDNSVKKYEPRTALDGGNDGIKYIRELLEQMNKKDLNPKALFLETEDSISNETVKLLKEYLPDYEINQKNDLFGRDRFVYAYLIS